jgi:hypothetical protein
VWENQKRFGLFLQKAREGRIYFVSSPSRKDFYLHFERRSSGVQVGYYVVCRVWF